MIDSHYFNIKIFAHLTCSSQITSVYDELSTGTVTKKSSELEFNLTRSRSAPPVPTVYSLLVSNLFSHYKIILKI